MASLITKLFLILAMVWYLPVIIASISVVPAVIHGGWWIVLSVFLWIVSVLTILAKIAFTNNHII